jgi:putative membrane protein
VTLRWVVTTGFALWLAARLVDGITLVPPDPLASVGTLLVVALGLNVVDSFTLPARRALLARCAPLPVAIGAAVAVNAALFWAAVGLAGAAGLGYTVGGFAPALFGSLLLPLVRSAFSRAPAR